MPDTYGYKQTLEICNTCYFYVARVVERKSLNVTLYVHCLCCYYLTYSIHFKFLPSLPNQRYPKPLFIPINHLGLLPDFLISCPCLRLVTTFYQLTVFHWKVMCRILLRHVQSLLPLLHLLQSSHSAAPFAVFFALLTTSLQTPPCTS